MSMIFSTDLQFALEADSQDNLAGFRKHFYIKDSSLIYLDGNSLGRLLLQTGDNLSGLIRQEWGENLINSWNEHWYDLPQKLGNSLAPLIGASDGEVLVTDSTSVNLYKLAHGAIKIRPGRTRLVSDSTNFPTDLYILQGLIRDFGPEYELVLAGSGDGISPDLEELDRLIDHNTALVVLSLVNFKSGYLYDLKRITRMAHEKGALILWDLSHAAGAVPINLNGVTADLAVGCTYKYLNGGPGSPAFLYVRRDIIRDVANPVQGWFGERNPFDFYLHYRPAEDIRKFLTGTPPIISLSAISCGIGILKEAGMENVRAKSILLGNYTLYLLEHLLKPLGYGNGSPENEAQRGSHIAIRHPEAYRICQAMIRPQNGKISVVPDFRDPDIIRIGITPLYTRFEDIFLAVRRMQEIAADREYLRYPATRQLVT